MRERERETETETERKQTDRQTRGFGLTAINSAPLSTDPQFKRAQAPSAEQRRARDIHGSYGVCIFLLVDKLCLFDVA